MTLGQKGIRGDNESTDAFNKPADVVIAKDGSIFITDVMGDVGAEATSRRPRR
jgi:ribosomal protein L14